MKNCFGYKSPIGNLVVCTEDIFLTGICFTTQGRASICHLERSHTKSKDPARTRSFGCVRRAHFTQDDKKIIKQLDSYFAGKLKKFDLPIKLAGTTFQKSVWKALARIPYGQTRSYSDIAKMIKRPRAVRAVGTAIGNNPIGIILPCHRIIRSDGKIGEFAWGVKIKKQLLKLESAI